MRLEGKSPKFKGSVLPRVFVASFNSLFRDCAWSWPLGVSSCIGGLREQGWEGFLPPSYLLQILQLKGPKAYRGVVLWLGVGCHMSEKHNGVHLKLYEEQGMTVKVDV